MLSKRFERQAEKHGSKLAIKAGEKFLTYRQLNQYANRIAYLINQREPGGLNISTVGLLFDHGAEMIAAILGVLKAGKVYVPLSPGYPLQRLSYMVSHSEVSLILTDSANRGLAAKLHGQSHIPVLNIEKIDNSIPGSNHKKEGYRDKPAYILYTSGSTGTPKGVVQTHENVLYFIDRYTESLRLSADDRLTLLAAFSHDAAVMDIYGALLNGAALYPLDIKKTLHWSRVSQWLIKEGITIWHSVPTVFRFFVNAVNPGEKFPHLRMIVLGGEEVLEHDIHMFKKLFPPALLCNLYGQTESSYNAAEFVTGKTPVKNVKLGRAIKGTKLLVVDEQGCEVIAQETGEIVVASPHVSPGYWKDEAATKKFFTYDPELGRLYWTGDLGRPLLDGRIEFVGRVDFQVKIRGHRVELGEIESQLLHHDRIKKTVVTAIKTGGSVFGGNCPETHLCAYFVPGEEVSVTGLKDYLGLRLPDHMIPTYFVQLEDIPRLPSGKVDRKALPLPGTGAGNLYEPPGDEVEEKIVDIWAEVLGLDKAQIGVNNNFFQLGGHSLKAMTLAARIHKTFNIKIELAEIFKTPVIRKLSQYIKQNAKEKYTSIVPAEEKEYYALSAAQRRLYILQQMEVDNISYNMPYVLSYGEDIDVKKLEEVFKKLISRHESLRTSFEMINREPVQRVHRQVNFALKYYETDKDQVETLIRDFIHPFDPGRPPLFRGARVKVNGSDPLLLMDMHHLITDGISRMLLKKEFMLLYAGKELSPLGLRYKDYSQWQQHPMVKESFRRQQEYWLKEFAGEIPLLDILTDYPRPSVQSFAGSVVIFDLDEEETVSLSKRVRDEGVTLFMVLLAVYNIFLTKLSSQEEIVVGIPTAGRRHPDLKNIMGMFVNTLPMRLCSPGARTFRQHLIEVKEITLKAFENQDYPFEELVEKLNTRRDASRNPLFDHMFAFQDMEEAVSGIPGLKLKPYSYERGTSKFDLTLQCVQRGINLALTFEYSTKLFRKRTIERCIGYLKTIISTVLENPLKRIVEIEIIPGEEKRRLLVDFNQTDAGYPKDKTLHELFREEAAKIPDRTAVVGSGRDLCPVKGVELKTGEHHLTYGELNATSNRLARVLKEKGVRPDILVGLLVERSIEIITGILAILKTGGAYLPIDPGYPGDRIEYMLKDSSANTLVTTGVLAEEGEKVKRWEGKMNLQMVFLDFSTLPSSAAVFAASTLTSALTCRVSPANLAYVIYTSGSTGSPKGVMIHHRALVNFIKAMTGIIDFKESDSLLSLTTVSFDIFGLEIFLPLTRGGKVVIGSSREQLNPEAAALVMSEQKITILQVTPSRLSLLISSQESAAALKSLKYLLVGGEAFPVQLLEKTRAITGSRIYNLYGPTETTIWSTAKDLTGREALDIGRPVANTRVYILGKGHSLQPIGIAGELCIGGDGVAGGYLNRPELTAEKFKRAVIGHSSFVISPSKKLSKSTNDQCPMTNDRLYKTGDKARWLPNGNLEFLGREDQQIKIRGFRVELGEIETQLAKHGEIKEVVVICRVNEQGDKYICAYVVPRGRAAAKKVPGAAQLREFLSPILPDYMVPSFFVHLDRIPLTPNGKTDREALPFPGIEVEESHIPPGNEKERKLASIWAHVLGIKKHIIGIDSNFFQLGGHSLKALIMISKIHREFGVRIPLAEFFRVSTIRGLAAYIEKSLQKQFISIEVQEKKDYYPLSSAQGRLYILHQADPEGTGYNITSVMILEGELHRTKFEGTFKKLIRRHEGLRTTFHMLEKEPVQKVSAEVEFNTRYLQFKAREKAEQVIKNFVRPFDLSAAPLLRVGLMDEEKQKHILMVDMHHIISDGISNRILLREFMDLYTDQALTTLRIHYKDYALWQNREIKNQQAENRENYWINVFSDEIPVSNLPTDYPRPLFKGFEGGAVGMVLDSRETNGLNRLAAREGATLFMMLSAIFNILLFKMSGQEDIVVGTPVAGRTHADLEHIIGMFVNTLALRNFPSGEKTFKGFLKEIKKSTLEAFENQEYPFEDLVEKVDVNRDAGRNPLFDVMLVLQNLDNVEINIPGLKLIPYDKKINSSKFDITLRVVELHDSLHFTLEYSTKLFKKKTMERWAKCFREIVLSVLGDPGRELSSIEILAPQEKQRLLFDFNDTTAGYPDNKTIHGLFQEQVKKTPDKIGLTGPPPGVPRGTGQQHLTYREINKKSRQLADILRSKGVKPGGIVGIILEARLEIPVVMLAILKAGGAFLPIDPGSPKERVQFLLSDSSAVAVITARSLPGGIVFKNHIIYMEDLQRHEMEPGEVNTPLPAVQADHLVYVIYTSGTTGKPKGVLLTHGNLVNYVYWFIRTARLKPEDNALLTSSYAFDLGYTSLYPPLLTGAGLHVIPGETYLEVHRLINYIETHMVTYLKVTPSFFSAFFQGTRISTGDFSYLRLVVLGGEPINTADLEKACHLLPHVQVINHYGPTEATIGCIAQFVPFDVEWFRRYKESPTIGRPIANTRVYILDKYMKPLPIGIPGELCIAGTGLARGYLNRPELTAEKFCLRRPGGTLFEKTAPPGPPRKNFLLEGTRGLAPLLLKDPGKNYMPIYHTGDLGRWLPEGTIEFLDRIDSQVKIRGYRIELGEIENQLLNHPGIQEAAVIPIKNERGNKYLCAYMVSTQNIPVSGLREYLLKRLPEYMVPSLFIPLERIPLTPNGKVDGKALPQPRIKGIGEDIISPRDKHERKLAEIWAEVLDIRSDIIGIDSNFFQLEGNSLKAVVMITQIHQAFDVKVPLAEIFKTPTIRGISKFIRGSHQVPFTSIKAVEKKEWYPLSSAQKRLYILHQVNLEGTGYNIPSIMTLTGELNREQLEETFRKLTRRHESLRTSFHMPDNEPVQRVHEKLEFETRYFEVKIEEEVEKTIKNFIRPFDLSFAPLLRVGLIGTHGLSPQQQYMYIMMVDIHHIISDGMSNRILLREFMDLYAGQPLTPLPLQYRDYARWQAVEKEKSPVKRQKTFWITQFSGNIPVLNLPLDYPRPHLQGFEGSAIGLMLDSEKTRRLKQLADKEETTLFMVLLAILNVLLFKLSGQEDIVVGTALAGRRHINLQHIIGMFINTLALRNFPSGEKGFKDFLQEIKKHTLQAFENQEYPFEELVEQVAVNRDASANPLFDVMLILQNLDKVEIDMPGLKLMPYYKKINSSKFDITFRGAERDGCLHFTLEYSTKLFKKQTIERFSQYFKKIVSSVLDDHEQQLSGIEIISEEEKKQVLFDFNNTPAAYPGNKTIPGLFAEQVRKKPDKISVVGTVHRDLRTVPPVQPHRLIGSGSTGDTAALTYRELNERSNRLAHLLTNKGVKADDIAAIVTERSVAMITGIMGILKAGAAYMPIEPGYPAKRVKHMLADSGANVLVTTSTLTGEVKKFRSLEVKKIFQIIFVDSHEFTDISPSHLPTFSPSSSLAYVIYTSGSTGRPQGVMVEQRNVVHLVSGLRQRIYSKHSKKGNGENLGVCMVSPYIFDASVKQVFAVLLLGHTLYIVDEETRVDGSLLLAFYRKNCIRVSDGTPAHLRLLLESAGNNPRELGVKNFLIGGEALPKSLAEDFLSCCHPVEKTGKSMVITNVYGPSECTVDTTSYEVSKENIGSLNTNTIPIGIPLPGVRVYITGVGRKENRLQPIGVTGELCVGGAGTARGYLNNPELTSQKFDHDLWDLQDYRDRRKTKKAEKVPGKNYLPMHPCIHATMQLSPHHSPHYPIYHTGDLARWLKDGNIEFLGRIDHQVQIRGYRIELGEIETHLLNHNNIKEAVVILGSSEKENKYLCAYIVLYHPIPVPVPGIKEYLSDQLPGYMVPSQVVVLEQIPLTPNGKVDRKALPKPDMGEIGDFTAPRGQLEKKLAGIWAGVLTVKTNSIGIDSNFFQLGGNSLNATVMIAKIHKELNVKIPLAEIFNTPTIRGISKYIKDSGENRFHSIEAVEKKEYYLLSSAQKRLYILEDIGDLGTTYNLPKIINIHGKLNENRFKEVILALINQHESLRTSFHAIEGDPVQRVYDRINFEIEHYHLTPGNHTKTAAALISDFIRPFDLSEIPLFRVGLIKVEKEKGILMIDMHHIISDGVSMGILMQDFFLLYKEEKISPLKIYYKDFTEWQNRVFAAGAIKQQENYWLNRMKGNIQLLNLPTDYPRPFTREFEGNRLSFNIDEELTARIKEILVHSNTTLPIVCLAAFSILLARYSQQEDIIVGMPIAGRNHADTEQVIGFFVNTLAIRNHPNGEKTFSQFLQEVKTNALEAYENQDYPLDELVDKLKIPRNVNRNPMFDVLFASEDIDKPEWQMEGIKFSSYAFTRRVAHLDLVLYMTEVNSIIRMVFEYGTALFKASTVENMALRCIEILQQAVADQNIKLKDIELSLKLKDAALNKNYQDFMDFDL